MTSAVIVAAGKGTRMGPGTDKLFLEVHGIPVVGHTWRRFDSCKAIDEIILVAREGMEDLFKGLAATLGCSKPFRFAKGGSERQDSVWNGLEAVSAGSEVVAIQDGARPCTSEDVIVGTIDAARLHGAAVAAQPVNDTIKESADGKWVERTVDRSRLWAVQTPQSFRVAVIREALRGVRARGLVVTDDTAACELIGQRVYLVVSSAPNPKVTRPEDLPYINLLLQKA